MGQVSIPAEAVKTDPLRCQNTSDNWNVLLDACDSYVRDDITLGEEQAAQDCRDPEDEIQIPQEAEVPVIEATVAETVAAASEIEKAPETVQKEKRGRPKGSTKKKM